MPKARSSQSKCSAALCSAPGGCRLSLAILWKPDRPTSHVHEFAKMGPSSRKLWEIPAKHEVLANCTVWVVCTPQKVTVFCCFSP